jgi:hypothetical protein
VAKSLYVATWSESGHVVELPSSRSPPATSQKARNFLSGSSFWQTPEPPAARRAVVLLHHDVQLPAQPSLQIDVIIARESSSYDCRLFFFIQTTRFHRKEDYGVLDGRGGLGGDTQDCRFAEHDVTNHIMFSNPPFVYYLSFGSSSIGHVVSFLGQNDFGLVMMISVSP